MFGAAGGATGAAAGLNQTANNYVTHSSFASVRALAVQENARLTLECGSNCTQADFLRIDQQVAEPKRIGDLDAIQQASTLRMSQTQKMAQLTLELLPVSNEILAF